MPRRNYDNSKRSKVKIRPHTRSSGHARLRPKPVGWSPEFMREFGHLIIVPLPAYGILGFAWALGVVLSKKRVLTG